MIEQTAAPAAKPQIANPFKKAIKYNAKGRVALVGPSGSGKSMTALMWARTLVGPTGRIAAIDTEHGSLSKYANEKYPGDPNQTFQFDVEELDSFSPDIFMARLKAAEANSYDALIVDSLSHFWVGKDGALEFVDMAAKRYKDNMGGWKEFRPHERAMVDAMIASPMHIFVTMRTKTEYSEVEVNGKKKRVKVGLQPVQREGLEYEFDLVGYMDEENTLIVDKTRCSFYSKKAFTAPTEKELTPFRDWLTGEKVPETITIAQAQELHAQAQAKKMSNESLLAHLGVARLGNLPIGEFNKALAWIAAQKAPLSMAEIGKEYDDQIEMLIRRGVSSNAVGDYIDTLPFAKDMQAVTAHLKSLVEKNPGPGLIALFAPKKEEAKK